ncbi:MAG TPA: hypothetical protein DD808_00590 [Halieaceae bacterium]|jgi:glucokinase|uniref:glucokinase n=1 Tax=Haliea TaxID=475794 RepID=UPI000C62A37B|nr:glucokinase [Haliea sp.]HBQ39061.1 hypothetical protein [Halieaceae bacterium]MAD64063.1 hypothetical protein [Haliea sp.]MAY92468.1 hypothetical protein [Haliea sp.]MBK40904.1 hypothetical protein [Haliea sp.]MBP68521.1 hypothetical protein [Haliea sp.]|tara:strand:- start:1733 stop:2707 length:975 start_codon:yes stop_codon:yes gene_type:complete
MTGASTGLRLVADVGGTNSRVALFDPRDGSLQALRVYQNASHADFGAVLESWFREVDADAPREACIAVAAPPSGNNARMINIDWELRGAELAQRFGIRQLGLMNDFEANACALPWLRPQDSTTLQAGRTTKPARLAVLGPGTGLGGAVLDMRTDGAVAVACEPGQMDLAPLGAAQMALWPVLQRHHPRIYAELLLSGAGLRRLYLALGEAEGKVTEDLDPAAISARGVAGSDPLCVATLTQFCAFLGAASANFVLANGTYDALYLAGGIVPRMVPFLQQSAFLSCFHDRGPLQSALQRTAVAVITHPYPGLVGAGRAPLAGAAC